MTEMERMPKRQRARNDHVNVGGTDLLKAVVKVTEQMEIIRSKLDEHAERLDKGLQALNDKVDFITNQLNKFMTKGNNNPSIYIQEEIDPEQRNQINTVPHFGNPNTNFLDEPEEFRSRQSSQNSVCSQKSSDSGFVYVSSTGSETNKKLTNQDRAVHELTESGITSDVVKAGDTLNKKDSETVGNGKDYNQKAKTNNKAIGNDSEISRYLDEKSLNRNTVSESSSTTSVYQDRKSEKIYMRDLGTESNSNDSDITDSESSTNSTEVTDETFDLHQQKARVKIEPVVEDSDSDPDIGGHKDGNHEQKVTDDETCEMETCDDLMKQLNQQIQDNKLSHPKKTNQEGETQLWNIEYQETEQLTQQNQQDNNDYSSERNQNNRFTDENQDELENSIDVIEGPDQRSNSITNSRKRLNGLNYGSYDIYKGRSESPEPVCSKRKVKKYSILKTMKTHVLEDNRPKYLDRIFEFLTNTDEAVMKDREEPVSRILADSLQQVNSLSESANFQNNQQIPVSGLKNEHRQGDNRFIEEAHADPSPISLQQCQYKNMSIIQPNTPTRDVSVDETNLNSVDGYTQNEINERKKKQFQASTTVSDKELHLLVQNEQQDAKDCKDPKSMHGIDTVICLDVSASMAGQPLENAKQFILNFLEGLDESAADYNLEENVAMVTFGCQNRVLQHLTNNFDLIRNSLDTLEAGGPSPLWLGIALCLTELAVRGGSCTMDSLKVLPRIIIISDFLSSVKNRLVGPDIQQTDEKIYGPSDLEVYLRNGENIFVFMEGNAEVVGIVNKNRKSVSSFDFVVVGENINQVLLDFVAQDRQFTLDDVLYLSQFFRAQDTVNIVLSEMVEDELNEDFVKNLMRNRGMTYRSERDIMRLIRQRTPTNEGSRGEQAPIDSTQEQDIQSTLVTIDDVVEPAFGSHVKANPEFVGYHTRQNLLGTVIAPRKQGCLKVLWEDGTQERLKYGVNGEYYVVLDDVIHDVMKDGIRVGTVVERGRDWRWGEQDGGPGNPGVVCSYDSKKKVVNVLWQKGGQGNYRYGYKSFYDVAIRSELQKERDETEKHTYWQMQLQGDSWVFFAPEVNKTIETRYDSKDRSTFLVNIEDMSYRISFNSMTARSSLTSINHPIQRLELTKTEWRRMSNET